MHPVPGYGVELNGVLVTLQLDYELRGYNHGFSMIQIIQSHGTKCSAREK